VRKVIVTYEGEYGEVDKTEHDGPFYEINNGGCLYIKKGVSSPDAEAIYAKGIWRTVCTAG
jgi:hypothetical protein